MKAIPRQAPALLALLSGLILGGCDLALASLVVPGVAPGVGFPIKGRVVDGRTRLPIGGATVVAGIGWATTDGQGRFNLIGHLASREVTAARIGYATLTLGDVDVEGRSEVELVLQPAQSSQLNTLPKRFLELRGTFAGANLGGGAVVATVGRVVGVKEGTYALSFAGEVPGKVITAAMGWGATEGQYSNEGPVDQPFRFTNFSYGINSWPLAESIPEAQALVPSLNLQATAGVPFRDVQVAYSNVGSYTSVATEVQLDFGVAGAIPVARGSGSNQVLPVPNLPGVKYVVSGEARDSGGKRSSTVTLTTNDPSKAAFPLMPPLEVKGPNGARAGARPTFSWRPLNLPGIVYEISMAESGEPGLKWTARTTLPEVTFPGFPPGDLNNGALRSDKSYAWVLRAIDTLEERDFPSSFHLLQAGPTPVQPFRVRERQAIVRDLAFTP